MRAQMGHAAPFGLTRVEVGNEESNMGGYAPHYKLITDKLWAKDPALTIVASGRWGPSVEGSPCLTGQRCDVWDDHYYRTPDVMASLGAQYDGYNRSHPKVFVGEVDSIRLQTLVSRCVSKTSVRLPRALDSLRRMSATNARCAPRSLRASSCSASSATRTPSSPRRLRRCATTSMAPSMLT